MIGFLNTFSKLMAGAISAYLIAWSRGYGDDYGWLSLTLVGFLAVVWGLYGLYALGKRNGKRGSDT